MKMRLKNIFEIISRVGNASNELMGLGETVNEDDVAVIILNGVFSDYDIEVRLLEYGDDIKLREAWILKSLTHQYYRVQK